MTIPENWLIMKLEEACEIISGGTPSTLNDEYWNGEIAWATPTDITSLNGQIEITKTKRNITEKGLQHSSATILPIGSILVTSRATIGFCAINQIPIATNQGFKTLICRKEIHNYFIYYLINFLKPKLESLAGGSTFKEISRNSIGLLKILMPPYNEQIKISNILKSIDYSMQKTQKIFTETGKLMQGLLQFLLTKGIGHTEFKETTLGKIPKEWEIVRLAEIIDLFKNGGTPNTKIKSYYEGDIPFITGADFIENEIYISIGQKKISEDAIKNSAANKVPKGTILLVTRTCLGNVAIATNDIAFSQDITALFPKEGINKYYLVYCLAEISKEYFASRARGTTIKGITRDVVKNTLIPLPSLKEQESIVQMINSARNLITLNQKIIRYYKEVKKGLLQQLLTGKTRVKV